MAAKFELQTASDGQFCFHLKAGNGEIILASERYKQKTSCEKGIEAVKRCASSEARFERKMSKADQPYFVLKAENGEVIGVSEMYKSEAARDNGIKSVQTNGPSARIEDQAN